MDIKNLTLEELNALQNDINKQKDTIKKQQILEKQKLVENKLKILRENKELILSLIEHDRTSCSDDDCANGYGTASYGARCRKCHLIEILNGEWGNQFDVDISISINNTEL